MNKIETELESLDTKVGDNSTGLVKEITDARDGNSNLNTRLDSIESNISGLNTTLQSVQTSVTNVSQSVSGFVTQTTFDNQIASLNTVDTNLTVRVAEITNAHRDENDTLDERFDDLEAALSSSASGLSSRVETLETTVGNSSSGLVKEVTDARGNENSIDARLDAMDTTIAGKAANSDLDNKQAKITANGLLKGDGNGGITAAVAGTDYLVSHQDISGKADASALETLSGNV
jgi:predicted  nucleic acid-binding Zn-ribbon protein